MVLYIRRHHMASDRTLQLHGPPEEPPPELPASVPSWRSKRLSSCQGTAGRTPASATLISSWNSGEFIRSATVGRSCAEKAVHLLMSCVSDSGHRSSDRKRSKPRFGIVRPRGPMFPQYIRAPGKKLDGWSSAVVRHANSEVLNSTIPAGAPLDGSTKTVAPTTPPPC